MIKDKTVLLSLFICFSTVIASMNGCNPMHVNPTGNLSGSASFNDQAAFEKVQAVIASNCASCHGANGSATNLQLGSSQEFIQAGLVVPGNPGNSKLIFRLKNYLDGSSSNNNMPPSGEISSEDYQTLYSWVLNLSSGSSPFQCQETSFNMASLDSTNAKRLSRKQYVKTLRDFMTSLIGGNASQSVLDNVLNQVVIPEDQGVNFSRENNAFTGTHAESYFNVADAIANRLSQTYLNSVINNGVSINPGACSNPSSSNLSSVCRTQLIRNLASKAFRRPLRESNHMLTDNQGNVIDELSSLNVEFTNVSVQEGINRVLFRLLLSPHFLFQIEDQDLLQQLPGQANIYKLSSYSIASRLSYRFWNTMPDDQLMNLANTTDLFEDGPYNVALEYVVSREDKLKQAMDEYFYDWLHLESTPRFNVNGRFTLIQPNVNFNENLRTAMINEVQDFGSFTVQSGGSFEDLFTSNVSVTRDSDLMRLYGINQSAPSSLTLQNAPRFPATERGGILTRSAMLISGSELTNPIIRGAHIRERILCLTLGAPPADALDQFESIPVPHISSTREKVDIKTSGASCVGCHNLINPLGFGLSNYDAFGSFINQEPIFNNNQDVVDAYVNVDAHVDLSSLVGPGVSASDAVELSRQISEQTSTKACFSKKFMSYAMIRNIDENQDACRLDRIYNALDKDARLIDMVRITASDPELRLRKIEGQ